MPSPTRRELAKRLDDLNGTQPDESHDEPDELTEREEEAIDAIIDRRSDEELALANAIAEYAEDVGEPFFDEPTHDYDRGGPMRELTQAEVDHLEIMMSPEDSVGKIDSERYEEYL